jgi:hypothetical protein
MMNIVELATEYGIKNLRFFIPMRPLEMMGIIPGIAFKTSNSTPEIVECEIDESRYVVADGYKITLASIDKRFGREHFYISDFESLMKHHPDEYKVYALTIDGYTKL